MTSHSFALDRLAGEYAIRVREYEEGDEAVLATCREQVSKGAFYCYHHINSYYCNVIITSLPYNLL